MRQRDMQDIIGGILLTALGLFAAFYAQRYEFGSLNRMGPGYFPVASGERMDIKWKTFGIIIGSVVLFGATLKLLGIILATVLAVFVASLADNQITWRGRAMVSVGVAAITYLVFIYGLSMVLPVWPWSP